MLSSGKNLKQAWFSNIQQMKDEEIDFLYSCVAETEGDILEIGMGGSTVAFLDATKDTAREVWSIDLRNKLEDHLEYIPLDYQNRLKFIQEDSHKLALKKEFGLLLVDGDHTFTSVRKDTMAFWENVSDNGLILYHDYDMPDVSSFVDSWVSEFEYAFIHKRKCNLVALKKI